MVKLFWGMRNMTGAEDAVLTPTEMRQWLQREVREVLKAAELRVKDATEIVTGYAVGDLTPQAAMDRFDLYNKRWSEPIPGVVTAEGMTDEEILHRRDVAALGAKWSKAPSDIKPSR